MSNRRTGTTLVAAVLLCSSPFFWLEAIAQQPFVSTTIDDIWNDVSSACKSGSFTATRECATQHDYVIMANGQFLTTTGNDKPLQLRNEFTGCARWKFIRSTDVFWVGATPYSHLIYQDPSSGCGDDIYLQIQPDTEGLSYSNVMPLSELLFLDTDQWQIMQKGNGLVEKREPVECPDAYNEAVCETSRHTMFEIPSDYTYGACCERVTYQEETTQTYLTVSGSTASHTTGSPVNWEIKQVQTTSDSGIPVTLTIGPNGSSASNCPLYMTLCDSVGTEHSGTISGISTNAHLSTYLMSNGAACAPYDALEAYIASNCSDSMEISEITWSDPSPATFSDDFPGNGGGATTFWLRNPVVHPGVGGVGSCLSRSFYGPGANQIVTGDCESEAE